MNIKVIVAVMTLLVMGAAVLTAVFEQPQSKPKETVLATGGGRQLNDLPPGDPDPCSPSPAQSPGE